MASPRLVLCGSARLSSEAEPWSTLQPLQLRIGRGRGRVHVRIANISRVQAARLPDVAADLIEVASYVYAADQAVSRGGPREFEYGTRWRRHFRFEIPVRCPELWRQPAVRGTLEATLGFLSDDDYEFGFSLYRNPVPLQSYLFEAESAALGRPFDEVMLFSGGLDSLAGAVINMILGRRKTALVSHRAATKMFAVQGDLIQELQRFIPDPRLYPRHVAIDVDKGKALTHDFNQRTRSFLFAALGAVVARALDLPTLRMYENGVIAINLPISPQVLGARASRTAHPQVLDGFSALFTHLFGGTFVVDNPFRWDTRTDILKRLRDSGHGGLCARSVSCVHPIAMTSQHPHCGRCSQCVDRRLCALAAGLTAAEDPPSGYASNVLIDEHQGTDLTLIERYLGTVRSVAKLPNPLQFMAVYGEGTRVLRHCGVSAAEAAEKVFRLYRKHAEQILDAIGMGFAQYGDLVARDTLIPTSMLGLARGRSYRQPGVTVAASREANAPAKPPVLLVDRDTFTAHYDGRHCALGNTKEFALVEFLSQRAGIYVSFDTLGKVVWDNEDTSRGTIQRTASYLRAALRDHGMSAIDIDGSQRRHLCLTTP